METRDKALIQKVQIASELQSITEIQEICERLKQEIAIEKVKVNEKANKRGVLDDPAIIIAIISASSAVIVALIKAFVSISKINKLKGTITIKTDTSTIKTDGEGSAKYMQKWIDSLGKSSIIKQISLLSDKDDDDEFDI